MSLKMKILSASIGIMIVLISILFWLYAEGDKKKTIEAHVAKARSICLIAESIREEMEKKWEQGLFTTDQLKRYAEAGEMDKILSAVPVITAWSAAMRQSEQNDYQFRTPNFNPRNPKNLPDYNLGYTIEGPALKHMEENNLHEYYTIDQHNNSVRYFLSVRLNKGCLLCHGDSAQSYTVWGRNDGNDLTGNPMENKGENDFRGAFEVIQSLDTADAYRVSGLKKAALIVFIAFIVTGLLMWGIASGITQPVHHIIDVMARVHQGDLTPRVEICGLSEIDHLGEWFNNLLERLQEMIQGIVKSVDTLTASVEKISNTVESQAAFASELSASVTQITSTMSELLASSSQIAEHSNSVSDIADHALQSTVEGAEAVELIQKTMNEIHDDNQNNIREIIQLGDKSREITKVMEIINTISDQTKLIAFNAALEASSAGESGKRFGVVAAEIRRLASSVTESTGEIEGKISEIQEAVNRMIIDSENSSKIIRKGLNYSAQTAAKINEMVNDSQTTASAAKQISSSTQEQKTASEQVLSALREIDKGGKQVINSINKINTISKELNVLSGNLKELVNRFKLTAPMGKKSSVYAQTGDQG